MSGCASRNHGVNGREQIRCDGSFEDKSIGSRCDRGEFRILFVVDAESDQLQFRELAAEFGELAPARLRVGATDRPRPGRRATVAHSRPAKLHLPPPQPPQTLSRAGRVRLPRGRDADLPRAHSLFLLRASLHFAFAVRGVPTFRANLGPGTRRHDLEDLLALGMKNYGARSDREVMGKGPIALSRFDGLRQLNPIRVLLDNDARFLGSGCGYSSNDTADYC